MYFSILISSCLFVVVSSAHTRVLCKNQYNDLGICLPNKDCVESKGINIGSCSPGKGSLTCCYDLPCSKLHLFSEPTKKRKRRAILHPLPDAPMLQARVDPVCGLRKESGHEQQDGTTGREIFSQREEQLINGISSIIMIIDSLGCLEYGQ